MPGTRRSHGTVVAWPTLEHGFALQCRSTARPDGLLLGGPAAEAADAAEKMREGVSRACTESRG